MSVVFISFVVKKNRYDIFVNTHVIQTTEGRKNLGDINKYINEDVPEILRYALNDMGVNKYIYQSPLKFYFCK